MSDQKIFEPIGYIVALVTAIFSLILFYSDTKAFLGSLSAALMAAGLVWVSYIILRIFVLAIKK